MYGTVLVLCVIFHSGKSTIMITIAFSLLLLGQILRCCCCCHRQPKQKIAGCDGDVEKMVTMPCMCVCILVWPHIKQHSTHTHTERSSQKRGWEARSLEQGVCHQPLSVTRLFRAALYWLWCGRVWAEECRPIRSHNTERSLRRVARCCSHDQNGEQKIHK